MSIKASDKWRSPSRGAPEQAIATFTAWGSFPIGQVSAAVWEIYRLCDLVGLDAALLVSHAAVETGSASTGKGFLSEAWATDRRETSTTNRYNIAGIGITDGGDLGYGFSGGLQAARAFVVHHARYEIPGNDPAWGYLAPYLSLDPRYADVSIANRGTVVTVEQMTGKWWTNTTGDEALVARGNAIFPGIPDQTSSTQGDITVANLNFNPKLAPLPKHNVIFAWDKVQGVGMDYLGRRTFRGNTFHRCLSGNQTFANAIDWLLRGTTAGLADAFIDHRTGEMTFINPMRALASTLSFDIPDLWDDMAGWTNGPYQSWVASDDAKAFVGAYGGQLGANIINQDLENFEITGDYEDPISDACKETIIQFMCNRAQVLKIPYSSWPINPATGLTVIYGHREWCGTDYKLCPGVVVWTWMNGEMIGLVQERLKKIQTSGAVVTPPPVKPSKPTYAAPTIPDWITNWDGRAVIADVPNVEDGLVYATTSQYVAIRDTPRYKVADTRNTQRTGATIKAGEDFNVSFVFTARDGKQWGVTPYGTRVLLADLKIVGDDALKAA